MNEILGSQLGHKPKKELGPKPEKESRKVEYEILDSPESRLQLLERTDEIINYVRDENLDVLIFLDKSARPLS